jgi:hypothetical protein
VNQAYPHQQDSVTNADTLQQKQYTQFVKEKPVVALQGRFEGSTPHGAPHRTADVQVE